MILKYFMKNILLSRRIWFFGILFGLFLLYVGYSQSTQGMVLNRIDDTAYSGAWLGMIILFLFGIISTTVAQSGIYSASSLPYLFKFSRYNRGSYLYNISLSSLAVSMGLSAILAVIGIALFSEKFGISIYVNSVAATFLVTMLGAAFMTFVALLLVLVSINYFGTKSINYIHFVPLMMTYAFGIITLSTRIPDREFFYFVPFSAFLGIFEVYFSGAKILLYGISPPLNDTYMLACLGLWTLAIIVIDLLLLSRLKVPSLEEAVQV